MNQILLINACIRQEQSRTLKIARQFIKAYKELNPNDSITELDLCELELPSIMGSLFKKREKLLEANNLDDPFFDLSKQFSAADKVIIAAPFWDLSFPSALKVYIEHISVDGITFKYEDDQLKGRCKAEKLLYITTRGGEFEYGPDKELEMGIPYIKAISKMYGIKNVQTISADGLDIIGNNAAEILNNAVQKALDICKDY